MVAPFEREFGLGCVIARHRMGSGSPRRRPERGSRVVLADDSRIVLGNEAAGRKVGYRGFVLQRIWALRRYYFDVAIVLAAAGAVAELVGGRHHDNAPTGPLWAFSLILAVQTLVLLGRRQFPFGAPAAVFVIGAVASFIDGRLDTFTFATFLTVLAAEFLFGMLPERRQALVGLGIGIGAAALVVTADPQQGLGDVAFIALTFLIVWLAGFGLSGKLQQVQRAEERAWQLEREREEQARTAVAEERARIARELHDLVGHSVSVMTVQTSAVRRLLREDQEREREALQVVEDTGRQALAEMRKLVGVLRRPEEAPALAPQPSLEHLDKLLAQVREAGLPVDLRVEGERKGLPQGIDLTAYRVIQEALTNSLKHAQARHAEVVVHYEDGEVELVVTDDGRGWGTRTDGGHGLVGMRERVALWGGTLDAGPCNGGGFELRARLPVSAG
jgi:signal transduction histidine kinase